MDEDAEPDAARPEVWTSPTARIVLYVLLGVYVVALAFQLLSGRWSPLERGLRGVFGLVLAAGAGIEAFRRTQAGTWSGINAFSRWFFVLILVGVTALCGAALLR